MAPIIFEFKPDATKPTSRAYRQLSNSGGFYCKFKVRSALEPSNAKKLAGVML
jgi:hypothetical protein